MPLLTSAIGGSAPSHPSSSMQQQQQSVPVMDTEKVAVALLWQLFARPVVRNEQLQHFDSEQAATPPASSRDIPHYAAAPTTSTLR